MEREDFEPEDLLRVVMQVCEQLELPYFVTDSTATIAYGEPRFTNDIDIVIEMSIEMVRPFCARFATDDYYLSESAVMFAVEKRSQFNLIHPESGLKVDFMVAPSTDFNQSRMKRARDLPVLEGKSVKFASPEDAILMKLKYFQEGQSGKHLRDIRGVLKIQGNKIDVPYIVEWARRLEVEHEWKLVLNGME